VAIDTSTVTLQGEFAVPTPNSAPTDIIWPTFDDLLWFTELNADKITRFDPNTATFTEFVVAP
jgi:streptogramin lyase